MKVCKKLNNQAGIANRVLIAAFAGAALTGAQSVAAGVISFSAGNTGDVTGLAGVELVGNWNNDTVLSSYTNLIDDSGVATTLDITNISAQYSRWRISSTSPAVDTDGSFNKKLLNRYMNGGLGASPIVLAEIPYAVYDIIVYFSSDRADRTATITDGTTTFSISTLGAAAITDASGNAVLTESTDTGTLYPAASYVTFSGLTGDTKTITSTMISNAGGGIAGFQVVEVVPEPGSLALLGLGGLLIARRRRD